MGEVKPIKEMLADLGAPPAVAEALVGLVNACTIAGHDEVDKMADDTLLGAFTSVQRVMDLCGMLRNTLDAVGIHDTCAKRIAGDFEHPVAASVAQIGRQMQHALLDLHEMLTAKPPVELLNKIKAAHSPQKEETDGEGEGEAPIGTEGQADEGGAADTPPVADGE